MAGERLSPIYSDREDDADLREPIDAFVIGLGERIDTIQDAHVAGNASQLASLAGALEQDARALGYPIFARAAQGIRHSVESGDEDTARKAISEVTELAQRVRLGHRGAA